MYTISVDRSVIDPAAVRDAGRPAARIDIVLAGLLSVEEVRGLTLTLRQRLAAEGVAGNYAIVIDVTGCGPQTQDVARALGEEMAAIPRSQRLAIVVASQIAKLQVRRLFPQAHARFVSTRAEALGWADHAREPAGDGRVAGRDVERELADVA